MMKILIFGATGMIGQGVLRECLLDNNVTSVLSIGRSVTGIIHPKLREVVHRDQLDYTSLAETLTGWDGCFYCLGVSSAGMSEALYHQITYDMTMAVAPLLARQNPQMTFVYTSATMADSTEKGRVMWARVKGKVENALFRLPFKRVFAIRPGMIQPLHGIRSRTTLYRILYLWMTPFFPLFKKMTPNLVTTTERIGRAMLVLAQKGDGKQILENIDMNRIASTSQTSA